jgi:hypothetical protein
MAGMIFSYCDATRYASRNASGEADAFLSEIVLM